MNYHTATLQSTSDNKRCTPALSVTHLAAILAGTCCVFAVILLRPNVSSHKVFIDRAHDIDVADPTYYTRYARYLNQEAFYAEENIVIPDYDIVPQRVAVRPEYDDVFEDSNWWVSSSLDFPKAALAGESRSQQYFRGGEDAPKRSPGKPSATCSQIPPIGFRAKLPPFPGGLYFISHAAHNTRCPPGQD